MSKIDKFQKLSIDIVDILKSPAVVGMFRGNEIWSEIEKQLDEVPNDTLVLIDLRRSSPLQYEFCQYAFGPLFEALINGKWPRKYVIFQMHDFHKEGFFRGILKHLQIKLERKEAQKAFESNGYYGKLIIGDEKVITFVGNMDKNQNMILDIVNGMKSVTSKEIVEKSSLSEESVVDALRFLVSKYFIIGFENDQSKTAPVYYSFYQYLV